MEWTKYTTKEALKDNDELMILDKDANANKRTLLDKVSGTTGAVEIAANSTQTVAVVFKKPFNIIPTVVCTLKSGSNIATYGDLTAFVDYASVTKNGFTIKLSNACTTSGAKPSISWIATVS